MRPPNANSTWGFGSATPAIADTVNPSEAPTASSPIPAKGTPDAAAGVRRVDHEPGAGHVRGGPAVVGPALGGAEDRPVQADRDDGAAGKRAEPVIPGSLLADVPVPGERLARRGDTAHERPDRGPVPRLCVPDEHAAQHGQGGRGSLPVFRTVPARNHAIGAGVRRSAVSC